MFITAAMSGCRGTDLIGTVNAAPMRPASPRTLVAVVSTVKVRLAGVASTLPAVSVALTSKAWEPSGRFE